MLNGDVGLADDLIRREDLDPVVLDQRAQRGQGMLETRLRVAGNQSNEHGSVNPVARSHVLDCGKIPDRTESAPVEPSIGAVRDGPGRFDGALA